MKKFKWIFKKNVAISPLNFTSDISSRKQFDYLNFKYLNISGHGYYTKRYNFLSKLNPGLRGFTIPICKILDLINP